MDKEKVNKEFELLLTRLDNILNDQNTPDHEAVKELQEWRNDVSCNTTLNNIPSVKHWLKNYVDGWIDDLS